MSFSIKSKKSGKTYFLHGRDQVLKGGHKLKLYFFAQQPGESAMDALPEGYEVGENERTGLPLLRKKAKR